MAKKKRPVVRGRKPGTSARTATGRRSRANTFSPEPLKQSRATTGRFKPGDRYYVTEQQRRRSQGKREKFEAMGVTMGVVPGMQDDAFYRKKDQKRKKGLAANKTKRRGEIRRRAR